MFLLFLWLFYKQVYTYGAFTVHLKEHQVECFYEDLLLNQRLDISFIVINDAQNSQISFSLTDPQGIKKLDAYDTSFSNGIDAQTPGRHEFCFSNKHSASPKEITFTVYGPDEKKNFDTKYTPSSDASSGTRNLFYFHRTLVG
jgi:hypothetical protein